MGLFSGKFEKEGAGLPMPEGGPARYFSLLISNIWKLVGANVLFVLFSLPLITLPAALCALNRVCILIYKNGSCYLWQDFVGEFRASFLRSLLPALQENQHAIQQCRCSGGKNRLGPGNGPADRLCGGL